MFIKHLILVDAKDTLKNAIVLYIDFGSRPTLLNEVSWVCDPRIRKSIKE